MIEMTLAQIARIVGGQVDADPAGGATAVTGAAFVDSRHPVPGGLYLALVGERVDGHGFAQAAVADGAAAALASRPTGVPSVLVADVVAAVSALARHVVDTVPATVLALTGSAGKTGTKDYLAHLLAAAGPTVATVANNNNELGVPLTALRAESATAYLVLEMGARGGGHIGHLCQIAPPRIAAVLNIGSAHLGEFGSVEAIAQAKGEILEALPTDGRAVLNADDPRSLALAGRTVAPVLTFGRDGEVAWRDLELDDLGRASFRLGYAGTWSEVRLLQSGAHQVANAAAAAAMALAAGLALPDVAASLGTARSSARWRMEVTERADGLLVINDAYNASPEAMRAALASLAQIGRARGRRTVAVLGEMLELGAESSVQHRGVGSQLAEAGIDVLVAVGEPAAAIAEGAEATAGWRGEAIRTAGREAAVTWVRENVEATDVVLVKASRGAALEVVATELVGDSTDSTRGR